MNANAIERARAAGLDPDTRPHAPEARTAENLLAKMDADFEREHRRLMEVSSVRYTEHGIEMVLTAPPQLIDAEIRFE